MPLDAVWLWIAKLYAYLVWLFAKKFGVWVPGLGFVCRRIHREHVFTHAGRKYVFHPPAASMYGSLLVGKSMEPETHAFFAAVIPRLPSRLAFIDVGAAIGEMIIDVAGYANVDHVVGFDPDPDNVEACRRSAAANGFHHVTMIEKVVADAARDVDFRMNRRKGTSGQIRAREDGTTLRLQSTTLDREIPDVDGLVLMLIDVEGAEFLVLAGAPRLIARTRPLIVFEYITGRDHRMQEIAAFLGGAYEIYRLRADGTLDADMSRTWNCVAVHRDSAFYPICRALRQRPPAPHM